MSKTAYRIAAVAALPGSRLRVEYVGGNLIEVDLSELIAGSRAMSHLADAEQFAAVRVGDYGWTVVWDDDAEMSSDRLMEMALEQRGRTDALEFRRWQERNHLSLNAAAEAIGLTRRTVSQYRTGVRPVPRTVALACKGWEAERDHAPV
ncbi:DUF2442 domain-containing protein [Thauera aromatica]|uniref:DUF2442 domain-containing protein n=1 Tax=Thauera aromatica K172 TaxID=44139 RepID=A0A2R4BQY7_THAAR|nr:DUF2442 domain-containing protein [Thauera aromatica]AVR89748.1 hypothetical protein Tharo_2866 [Thauera aromatica K172]MCK2096010.1 DUF2442 domain-containing protein [Thauera aromatica]